MVNDVKYAVINNPVVNHNPATGFIITVHSSAPENAPGPFREYFSDSLTYLFVFNEKLEFLFPPVVQTRRKSGIGSIAINKGAELFIYAIFNGETNQDTSWLMKLNTQGDLIARKSLYSRHYGFFSYKGHSNSNLILVNRSTDEIFEVTPQLDFIKRKNNVLLGDKIHQFDLNNDGVLELITCRWNISKVFIYQKGFRHPVIIDFPELDAKHFQVSKCNFMDGGANFYFQSNGKGRYYLFSKNDFYFFKYPFYLGLYLAISLFLYLLLKLQKQNLQKKFEQEKRMTELELLTIKNQIDPHFTFNAINTLSAFIYSEDKKSAHQFLVGFSGMIRNTLNNSTKISIPLKDEIEFVENYLKLQQFRFVNKFDFAFQIDQNVDVDLMVPRMIIQTFAENAVKHGLVNKVGKGMLTIAIHPSGDIHTMTQSHRMNKPEPARLQIEITDDGIGRKKSKQAQNYRQTSTGHGHQIIKQIVEMYNRLNKTKVSFEITDLYDADKKCIGTKVLIQI